MARVQVFVPAMCCPTGVCGPSADPVLRKLAIVSEAKESCCSDSEVEAGCCGGEGACC